MKAKLYAVEELHRGEWQPITFRDDKGVKTPKTVSITEETAKQMNVDIKSTKTRYVPTTKEAVAKFVSENNEKSKDSGSVDAKPLNKMTKPELEAKALELGVEFTDEHSNNEKRAAAIQAKLDEAKQ